MKEPKELLFFGGNIFEIRSNKEWKFINSQRAFLFDLPSQEDISIWHKIKIIKATLGIKSIYIDPNSPRILFMQGFVEVEIGVAPYRTQFLENNTQSRRGEYGLKHHVTSTIHASMVDTLQSMPT